MRERRPGYWELRVSQGRDPVTGVARYATRNVRGTKREAQKALTALAKSVDDGREAKVAATVGSLLDQWLAHIEKEGRSPTTLEGYAKLRRQLPPAFLAKRLAAITPRVLDLLFAELARKPGRGPATVHHFHRMLRAAFTHGVRWEMLDRNPATLARPPRVVTKAIEPPAIGDIRIVLDAARVSKSPENALVFRFIAATGCRRAEACGLRWNDVDLAAGEVTLRHSVVQVKDVLTLKDTKAHQQRTVKLDRGTIDALNEHLVERRGIAADFEVEVRPSSFVFSNAPDGREPIPPNRLTQAWVRLAEQEGVSARLHDLRHFQASLLIDAGESIATVAARLGHRDTSTTLRVYAHLMPGADGRAAGIVGDALDR